MDYLQFRKKIILTRSYNFIFFETTASINNTINVGMIKINSVPIICVVGSSNALTALVETLNTMHLVANISDTISVLNDVDILSSINAKSNVSQSIELIGDSKLDAVELANVHNIEALVSIIANVYTPPPIIPMIVDIVFTFPITSKLIVDNSKITKVNIVSLDTITSEIKSTNPIDISSLSSTEISLTIVMANDNPVMIVGSINDNSISINTFIVSGSSKLVVAEQEINATIGANVGMCRYAKISDYTNNSLNDLNNQTIQKLTYFDII